MKLFNSLKEQTRNYPREFWILISAIFIDRVGGALVFPFLSLFITKKFSVGMTDVGSMFALFIGSAFWGNMLSGALADRFGRKKLIIIGLITSAISVLGMGLINSWGIFFYFVILSGFFAAIGGPATHAAMADLLPEEQRTEGFGILRVAENLARAIGPVIGGVLAGFDFTILFIVDCILSSITAFIVWRLLPETKPATISSDEEEPFLQTLRAYRNVFSDTLFLVFVLLTTLTTFVYIQMNTTLAVFLNQFHNIDPARIGILLSMNAGMIVLFQYFITKKVSKIHLFLAMSIGNILYALGFGLFGFSTQYWQFVLLLIIITVGELIIEPVIMAIITHLAPEDMRGRYMATFDVGWGIARAFGPWIAGWLIDNSDPNIIWYAGGIICAIVAFSYLMLKRSVGEQFQLKMDESKSAIKYN